LAQGLSYLKEALSNRGGSSTACARWLSTTWDSRARGAVAQREGARAGWDVEITQNVADLHFDKTLETGAYRVAQEAITMRANTLLRRAFEYSFGGTRPQ
jgi:hypothetical protein